LSPPTFNLSILCLDHIGRVDVTGTAGINAVNDLSFTVRSHLEPAGRGIKA
jgi:hypothetical protein